MRIQTFFQKWTRQLAIAAGMVVAGQQAVAHIDLISPRPLLDGKAMEHSALKVPPFGAPEVDVAAAPATTVKAGSEIDLEAEIYVFHPGEVVVLWTRDFDGADVEPAWEIPKPNAPIPHHNKLYAGRTPSPDEGKMWRARVTLPDVEGEIILVVRQIMHDKFDRNADGSVSLGRIYYHQAAKLNLVR